MKVKVFRKYDCSLTLDYLHECERMCDDMCKCSDCPLYNFHRCVQTVITPEHINLVQKWSNEHHEYLCIIR